MLISFLIFFFLFSGVGVLSALWRKNTTEDYFLAGRNVPSWLVAMSFGATISSGATFIGFAGLAYNTGITAVYTVAALTIGDHIGWLIAGTKIRSRAQERNVNTYPSLIGKLGDKDQPLVTFAASILTVVFLGAYCAAQLVAGAKIGESLFNIDFTYFVLMGAGVLLAYCWSGGIRASIWTDAVQAVLIWLSLVILIIAGLDKIGGIAIMWERLGQIDPKLVDLFQITHINVMVGWFAFGVGILGQPQLMVRHMVARTDQDIIAARRIYLSWRWMVLILACISGMVARVLIPAVEGVAFDPELSIPLLWQDLLPPVLVGLLLAGLFAATMSTADSLLLSASSALTQNIIPKWRDSYLFARLGTVCVTVLVVGISLSAGKGVLSLVILAWAGLGSALTPLVAVQLLGARPSQRLALLMMGGGFLTMILWRYGLGYNKIILDLVPAMAVGFVIFMVLYPIERKKHNALK